jgi:site-specific DNA recombinase
MIAAIYARKSTEQNGVADEAKSVTRQIENAKAYALRKGWAVDDAHVYVDDGISGAEFANRPAFVRLLTVVATKPHPPFQALVMSEESRLGREMVQTMGALRQIVVAGVRVFYYLEDKERTLDSPMEKAMMALESFGAEMEREKGRLRVTDAMLRKARAGHVCGGQPFGYRNREVLGPDGKRSHVGREVYEPEAAIVRRIFALCAEGKGVKAIAKLLNVEGIAAPRPKLGRPRAWAPSSVRVLLRREEYRGKSIWNCTRQKDQWGQSKVVRRPATERVEVAAPHLRIVDDDLWEAAHRRLASAAAVYVRSTNGQMWGRPPSGIESEHLLSGWGRCACCGGSMTVRASSHRRQFYYVCANYDRRGRTVCANSLRLPMARADAALVTKVRDYVLDPEIVEGAIVDAIQELRPGRDTIEAKRQSLVADLARIETEQLRFVAAIAAAGEMDALTRALKDSERTRARMQQELAALDGLARLDTFDPRRVERDLRTRLDEWRELVGRQTPIARQVLAKLLDGKVAWTPRREDGLYEFAGRVRFDQVLKGIVHTESLVAVRGIEPRSRG